MRKKVVNSGFTILEMLLALSVLSVGIMAAFTLSISNLQTAKNNYQRILAVNLAREGVEIVRNMRDTNWLKIDKNVADCDDYAGNGIAPCTWDYDFTESPTLVHYKDNFFLDGYGPIDSVEECWDRGGQCRLGALSDNTYGYEQGSDGDMARLIHLQAICFDANRSVSSSYNTGPTYVSSDLVCSNTNFEKRVGFRVTAEVYWISNGQPHTVEVVEDLYNWREYVN